MLYLFICAKMKKYDELWSSPKIWPHNRRISCQSLSLPTHYPLYSQVQWGTSSSVSVQTHIQLHSQETCRYHPPSADENLPSPDPAALGVEPQSRDPGAPIQGSGLNTDHSAWTLDWAGLSLSWFYKVIDGEQEIPRMTVDVSEGTSGCLAASWPGCLWVCRCPVWGTAGGVCLGQPGEGRGDWDCPAQPLNTPSAITACPGPASIQGRAWSKLDISILVVAAPTMQTLWRADSPIPEAIPRTQLSANEQPEGRGHGHVLLCKRHRAGESAWAQTPASLYGAPWPAGGTQDPPSAMLSPGAAAQGWAACGQNPCIAFPALIY